MAYVYYLMGPSGSGKDSILSGLRARLAQAGAQRVLIAHRYITRHWQSGGENHVELSEREFEQRVRSGLFKLHWQANGCRYGVGVEVEGWLAAGHSVLINGSRAHLAAARECFGTRLVGILVCVDRELMRQRLLQRGREDAAEIEQRLQRNRQFADHLAGQCLLLTNDGELNDAVLRLEQLIERHERIGVDV